MSAETPAQVIAHPCRLPSVEEARDAKTSRPCVLMYFEETLSGQSLRITLAPDDALELANLLIATAMRTEEAD